MKPYICPKSKECQDVCEYKQPHAHDDICDKGLSGSGCPKCVEYEDGSIMSEMVKIRDLANGILKEHFNLT